MRINILSTISRVVASEIGESLECLGKLTHATMNAENFQLCAKLIPSTYVQQAENARKSQEHKIKTFLEHVSLKLRNSFIQLANY